MLNQSSQLVAKQLENAINEDAKPGNVAWWPRQFPWQMFLRRRSKVDDLPIFAREVSVRSEAECIELTSRVESLKDQWDFSPSSGIHRLGGATCELRHHEPDTLATSRALLLDTFPKLYEDILRVLRETLQTEKVRYCERGFAPGFTIITGGRSDLSAHRPVDRLGKWLFARWQSRLQYGFLHTDGQGSFLGLPGYTHSCPQISILLPLQLPPQGHGLHIFEATDSEDSKTALRSRRTFVPYKVGTMLIFNGAHWHMTGCVPANGASWQRIMLIGHGIRVNGTWEIYY